MRIVDLYLLIILCLLLGACKGNSSSNKIENVKSKIQTYHRKDVDTINSHEPLSNDNVVRKISPDFFPISKSAISVFKENPSMWFSYDNGDEKLYIIPYTDFSITTAVLVSSLYKNENLNLLLKDKGIKYQNPNEQINIGTIKSDLGIQLGLQQKDVTKILGKPDAYSSDDKINQLEWKFEMDENTRDISLGHLKPFILDGLMFEVKMTFVNNKLLQVTYLYEVP